MLAPSVTIVVVALTIFLSLAVALRYGVSDNFVRTRFLMTAFFVFIVTTLTLSFWEHALATLPYTVPAIGVGIIAGYAIGVRTAKQKLMMQGIEYYMAHFAHVHLSDFVSFNWWSFVNFYSVMAALLLINLVGLSNVIFEGAETWAIASSIFGAFLIGSIIPYLAHLWTIRKIQVA